VYILLFAVDNCPTLGIYSYPPELLYLF